MIYLKNTLDRERPHAIVHGGKWSVAACGYRETSREDVEAMVGAGELAALVQDCTEDGGWPRWIIQGFGRKADGSPSDHFSTETGTLGVDSISYAASWGILEISELPLPKGLIFRVAGDEIIWAGEAAIT